MARILLLLWVVVISIQSLYKGLVYAYYVCNKAYIIEQLCENKSKPILRCNGKCHLKKVMSVQTAPSEDKQQPYLPVLEDIKMPPLFFQDIQPLWSFIPTLLTSIQNKARFDYQFYYAHELLFGIWHPPRLN